MKALIYKERLKYERWDVLILLLVLTISLFLAFGYKLLNDSIGLSPVEAIFALIFLASLLFLWFYLAKVRMKIEISESWIKFRYYPLHSKSRKVFFTEIKKVEAVNTPWTAEYTGLSVNFRPFDKIYSTIGRTGIEIYLKNGEVLFLGTKNPYKVKSLIDEKLETIS